MKPKERTSTGMGHRGKRRPNIARLNREKQIHRLRIRSNNVYADLENDDSQMLESNFSGTINMLGILDTEL